MLACSIDAFVTTEQVRSLQEIETRIVKWHSGGYFYVRGVQSLFKQRWAGVQSPFKQRWAGVQLHKLPLEERQSLMVTFNRVWTQRMQNPEEGDWQQIDRVNQAFAKVFHMREFQDIEQAALYAEQIIGPYITEICREDGAQKNCMRSVQIHHILQYFYNEVVGRIPPVFSKGWSHREQVRKLEEDLCVMRLRDMLRTLQCCEPARQLLCAIQEELYPFQKEVAAIVRQFSDVQDPRSHMFFKKVQYDILLRAQRVLLKFLDVCFKEYVTKDISGLQLYTRYRQAQYLQTVIFGCSRTEILYSRRGNVCSLGEFYGREDLRYERLRSLLEHYKGRLGDRVRPEVSLMITAPDGTTTHWT